jgi:hypothetical protein
VTIDQQIRKRRRRGGKGNVMHLPKGVSENSKISRDLCNQSKSSDYEFDEDLVCHGQMRWEAITHANRRHLMAIGT